MRKTFKYRLNPTSSQRTALQSMLDSCRWVSNKTLEVRKLTWEEQQLSLSRYDTNKLLTQWREEHEFLAKGHAQAMQDAQKRVELAFFRRVKAGEKEPGYPRFRSRDRYDSFTDPQEKSNWRLLDNGRVRLSKIGDVKLKLHRPTAGECKTLTVQRDAVGNWYACFSCLVEPNPLPPTNQVVGVDVGLTHFATLSDGSQIDNPRFFRKDEQALATGQCRLAKETKGTPEYCHRKRAINHLHQRIANRRRDFAHKEARKLVNEYQLIAFEDLNIIDMKAPRGGNPLGANRRGMNKSSGDVAWHQFVQFATSKAEDAGRSVVLVDPRNTTKACSGCGEIVPKSLSVRVHVCPKCGLVLDRDHNAALTILARGLASIGNASASVAVEAP